MADVYWKGGTGGTPTSWSTAANWVQIDGTTPYGSVPQAVDNVKVLFGSGAPFVTTTSLSVGPTIATTVNSLVCTQATDTMRTLLASNGNNLTISGAVPLATVGAETKQYNLRFTCDAATAGSASSAACIGESSGAAYVPNILSGCNALFVVQPANITTVTSIYLNVPSGATLDIVGMEFFDPTKTLGSVTYGSTGSQGVARSTLGGTITYSGANGTGLGSCIQHSSIGAYMNCVTGATIIINSPSVKTHNLNVNVGTGNQPLTIYANAPSAFAFTNSGVNSLTMINTAPVVLYNGSSIIMVQDDSVINASANVTFVNFGVLAGKKLTVNGSNGAQVTQVDVSGTVIVNGGTLDSIVAPADKVLAGVPRWTGATGADIGTLDIAADNPAVNTGRPPLGPFFPSSVDRSGIFS